MLLLRLRCEYPFFVKKEVVVATRFYSSLDIFGGKEGTVPKRSFDAEKNKNGLPDGKYFTLLLFGLSTEVHMS